MNIYKIEVYEAFYVSYEIEADSEEKARDLLYMGDQQPVEKDKALEWDILEIEEVES